MDAVIANPKVVQLGPMIVREQDTDFMHPTELEIVIASIQETQQIFLRQYTQGSFLLCAQRPKEELRTVLNLDFPRGQLIYPSGTNRPAPMSSAERASDSVNEAAQKRPYVYLGQGESDVYHERGRTALIVNTQCGRLIMSTFFNSSDNHGFLMRTATMMGVVAALTRLRTQDYRPYYWLERKLEDMQRVSATYGPRAIQRVWQMFDLGEHPTIHAWHRAQKNGELDSTRLFFD